MAWFTQHFTPWARAAIRSQGIDPDELRARVPEGWSIGGSGKSSFGPYSFSLRHEASGDCRWASAHYPSDVPAALDRLLAMASLTDDLEAQLRRSLEARNA